MTETISPLRKASRDVRRQQLIEATLEVLALKGYSALTVIDVAKAAGLSAGIISFHFESKDKLLAAALQYLAEEYRAAWINAVAAAGTDPAQRLRALLLADFDETVFTPRKLAAWIAFWGEKQGRPVYDAICGSFDRERVEVLQDICGALIAEGGYLADPALTARTLDALGDGLWYGMVSARNNSGGDASGARRAVTLALAAFFPKHFKPEF